MPAHVLVPTDGTEHATAGLEYSLASFPDASVTALYVVDPSHDDYASVGGRDPPERRAEEQGKRVLERASERAEEYGRELRTELRTGGPHTEILSVAAETDVDHVVMGSHGESPITRPFLGHVSEAVVRRSPVSTTIVPESVTVLRDRDLPGQILVPVDGSEQAEAALAYALETFPDGEHTAFHVLPMTVDRSRDAISGTYLEDVLVDLEDRASEILASATTLADELDASLETETAIGKPPTEIIEYAETNGYDQIVMGSHGRSLSARLLTGSVAERVTRRSPRTVTLVRGSYPTSTD